MKRVMILGGPGAGKSTLARDLGARTGLPVYHMDHIHHLPGWGARPLDEKVAMAHAIEAREEWIFEGGLSRTYPERMARADTLVVLDFPVGLRLWRVTRRWWKYRGKVRPDMAPGCPEQLPPDFLWYIVRTRRSGRARRLALGRAHPGFVHLTSSRAVARWLASVPVADAAASA
ncbi:MAG: hypothetical protein AAGH83_07510 [Pseudomonadota bacterium]